MYIEMGPESDASKRHRFALKIGKGKVVAVSPSYATRATALAKAKKLMAKVEGCDTVYEVPKLKVTS